MKNRTKPGKKIGPNISSQQIEEKINRISWIQSIGKSFISFGSTIGYLFSHGGSVISVELPNDSPIKWI